MTYATVRVYLAAVRFLHVSNGLGDPLAGKLQLDLLLKGVRKKKPGSKDTRLPITPLILDKLVGVLKAKPCTFESRMLWAACCLGFFGFLRSGEFTSDSNTYDPSWHLSIQDVTVDSISDLTILRVTLKGSKTDQVRKGTTIVVGKTGSHICPVLAVLSYIARRGFAPGPLFRHKDGTPLTRQHLVSKLRAALSEAGIDCQGFSGHSFRIGAATTAAAKGIPDSTIQTLGRWRSESFKRYIRLPNSELASVSAQLL